jgi:hypothetical protein
VSVTDDSRDALARALSDEMIWDDPGNWWVSMRENARDYADRVLGSDWLAEHDRAVAAAAFEDVKRIVQENYWDDDAMAPSGWEGLWDAIDAEFSKETES